MITKKRKNFGVIVTEYPDGRIETEDYGETCLGEEVRRSTRPVIKKLYDETMNLTPKKAGGMVIDAPIGGSLVAFPDVLPLSTPLGVGLYPIEKKVFPKAKQKIKNKIGKFIDKRPKLKRVSESQVHTTLNKWFNGKVPRRIFRYLEDDDEQQKEFGIVSNLEKAFCEGYLYAQREFNEALSNGMNDKTDNKMNKKPMSQSQLILLKGGKKIDS